MVGIGWNQSELFWPGLNQFEPVRTGQNQFELFGLCYNSFGLVRTSLIQFSADGSSLYLFFSCKRIPPSRFPSQLLVGCASCWECRNPWPVERLERTAMLREHDQSGPSLIQSPHTPFQGAQCPPSLLPNPSRAMAPHHLLQTSRMSSGSDKSHLKAAAETRLCATPGKCGIVCQTEEMSSQQRPCIFLWKFHWKWICSELEQRLLLQAEHLTCRGHSSTKVQDC